MQRAMLCGPSHKAEECVRVCVIRARSSDASLRCPSLRPCHILRPHTPRRWQRSVPAHSPEQPSRARSVDTRGSPGSHRQTRPPWQHPPPPPRDPQQTKRAPSRPSRFNACTPRPTSSGSSQSVCGRTAASPRSGAMSRRTQVGIGRSLRAQICISASRRVPWLMQLDSALR